MGLKDVIASLEKSKKLNANAFYNVHEPFAGVISTSSIVLDQLIGIGGYPKGRITEISGPEGTGKSTLALAGCYESIKQGGPALYLDFECGFNPDYAKAIGINLEDQDNFVVARPSCLEDGCKIAMEMMDNGAKFIVFDSVGRMTPRKLLEADLDAQSMGLQAREINRMLNIMIPKIQEHDVVALVINQLTSVIETGFAARFSQGPKEQTKGGKALKYFASLRIEIKSKKQHKAEMFNSLTGEKQLTPVAVDILAKITKNRFSEPFREGMFHLVYGKGIDNIKTIVDLAIVNNFIEKKGTWLIVPFYDNFKVQGAEKLVTKAREDVAFYKSLENKVFSEMQMQLKIDPGKVKVYSEEMEFDMLEGDSLYEE